MNNNIQLSMRMLCSIWKISPTEVKEEEVQWAAKCPLLVGTKPTTLEEVFAAFGGEGEIEPFNNTKGLSVRLPYERSELETPSLQTLFRNRPQDDDEKEFGFLLWLVIKAPQDRAFFVYSELGKQLAPHLAREVDDEDSTQGWMSDQERFFDDLERVRDEVEEALKYHYE